VYEMNHCDDENYEFDIRTGECVCLERACNDNHFWDFNSCSCKCHAYKECPSIDVNGVNH